VRVDRIPKATTSEVVTASPDDDVRTAAQRIAKMGKGLAVVCDAQGAPIGIISVIDINRAVAEHGAQAPGLPVRDVMNRDIALCAPDDMVEHALDTMMRRGIRHLPIVANGQLLGIVNIQELLKAQFDEAQFGIDEMRRYVTGIGYR